MQLTSTVTAGIDPSVLLASPPTAIGRFEVVGVIGRGANGIVYAAHDPVLGRDVAIKAVPLAAGDRVSRRAEANFTREARAVAGLNHPHIITVFDAGRTDTLAYIAMERLHGADLHDYLYSGARLTARQAAALMARIADAVHYAHKRGLIHRDIKPSNIFLARDMKPKVLDFGVALPRREQESLHRSRLIGTPNYMSPEQAQGMAIDARSDVFSLGAILYEMIAGRRAFSAPTTEQVLDQLINDEPAPVAGLRPGVPAELVRIIAKAMAKKVEARYQTAGELRNDLAAFAGGRDAEALRAPAKRMSVSGIRRLFALWPSVLALLVVAGSTALWLLQQERAAGPPPAAAAAADVGPLQAYSSGPAQDAPARLQP